MAVINGALGDDAKILNNKKTIGITYALRNKNNISDAIAMMKDITKDYDSVSIALCKFKVVDCGSDNKPIEKIEIVDDNETVIIVPIVPVIVPVLPVVNDSVVEAKGMIDGENSDVKNLIRYVPPEEVKSFPFDFEQIDGYDSSMDKSMLVGEINNQYWIRAFNRLTEAEIREVVAQYNILTPVGYSDAHGLLVEIPVGDAEAIDELSKIELTRGITSVRKRMYLGSGLIKIQSLHKIDSINDLPNDGGSPLDDSEGDNWHLGYINMAKAWTITTGSDEVWVGVVDNGFYPYHEDLCNESQIIPLYKDPQCLDSDSIGLLRTMEKYEHGTAVVGVIAAQTNNSKGMTGINWHTKVVVASYGEEEDESTKTIAKDIIEVERAFKSIFFE